MEIDLRDFYSNLVAVAIVVLVGVFFGKTKRIGEQTNKQLINSLLMVFMPAALFSAFLKTDSGASMNMFLLGLAGGAMVMVALVVVARVIFNKWFYRGDLRFESQFAFIFNNATFLGYPIVVSTFGDEGLVPYCGFIVAFNVALFSYGVWLFKRKLSWGLLRDTLLNPNIIAVLLGMVLFLLNISVPAPIGSAVGLVAGATTPLSLICIGYMLSRAHFLRLIRKWRLFVTALIQLVIGPLVTYWVLVGLEFPVAV